MNSRKVAVCTGVTGATVTSINQAAAKMARAGILVIDGKVWRTVYYRFATREEREGKVGTNLIFKECRQSAAMKRVLAVYGDMNLNLL
ncbi:protein ren [Escherichia coli]|uniref:protein ren n=1 Tax=Escherichia coli TaxID=562 RepID=UPI0038924FA2